MRASDVTLPSSAAVTPAVSDVAAAHSGDGGSSRNSSRVAPPVPSMTRATSAMSTNGVATTSTAAPTCGIVSEPDRRGEC